MSLKGLILASLSLIGVRLVRENSIKPLLLVDENVDNAYNLSYKLQKSDVVINADMDRGRALPLFSFAGPSTHPFVVAARAALNQDIFSIDCAKNLLIHYYNLVNPSCPNSILGIESNCPQLTDFPAWAVVMPWDNENAFEWREKIIRTVYSDNSRHGKKVGIEFGWAWAGPSSELKAEIESIRIMKVLKSIKKHGYKRHNGRDGDIVGSILAKSSLDWVWQSTGAQHRAAAMAALGYDTVPVRITKVIRREDVLSWPNVVRGLYSESEALKIFDNIYLANFNHVSADWDAYIVENGLD